MILLSRSRTRSVLGVIALATAVSLFASAAPPAALAQQILRNSAIPDEAPTELQCKFGQLAAYLETKTGTKVEYIPVTDHAAAMLIVFVLLVFAADLVSRRPRLELPAAPPRLKRR